MIKFAFWQFLVKQIFACFLKFLIYLRNAILYVEACFKLICVRSFFSREIALLRYSVRNIFLRCVISCGKVLFKEIVQLARYVKKFG